MEEQKVNFETAKLAKEKGFNWECFNYYQDSHRAGSFKVSSPLTNKLIDELHNKDSYCIIYFTAPTQSLLQKWLREIHNIYIFPDKTRIGGMFQYSIHERLENNDSVHKFKWNILKYSKEYEKYEEALEIGLQEALKLIKN